MSEELKPLPCPLCEENLKKTKTLIPNGDGGTWHIYDHGNDGVEFCPLIGVKILGSPDVLATWNHRPIEDALRAENERLRKAIREAQGCITFEINPSNYDHEDVCRLNDEAINACDILISALKGQEDE